MWLCCLIYHSSFNINTRIAGCVDVKSDGRSHYFYIYEILMRKKHGNPIQVLELWLTCDLVVRIILKMLIVEMLKSNFTDSPQCVRCGYLCAPQWQWERGEPQQQLPWKSLICSAIWSDTLQTSGSSTVVPSRCGEFQHKEYVIERWSREGPGWWRAGSESKFYHYHLCKIYCESLVILFY